MATSGLDRHESRYEEKLVNGKCTGIDNTDRSSLGVYTKDRLREEGRRRGHSTPEIFRGYSIFMKGKDPRDAHFITSRIGGICGDNQPTCSCYASEMAYGVRAAPPRRNG